MDRYDNLDLDLECDGGGGVAQKAALFGGMLKRSLKSGEPSVQVQQDLSNSSELSKSSDSLSDKSAKGNGGVFKGMFKKTTKSAKEEDSLSVSSELSKSSDSLTDNSTKDNGNVFKGMFKKTTKSAKDDQVQVSLSSQNKELSASDDGLLDKKSSKDKSGVLGGILKRSPKPGHVRRPSQDLLDKDFLTSENSQPENNNVKETGGMFSGIFKKPQKPFGARAQSQDDLSASGELSGSSDNLSVNHSAKESSGGFSAIFKKPFARTKSQDDLLEPSEHSGSSENLPEGNTKEKGGIFSGVFKKPKHFAARSQSQDDLTAENELSASSENLAEKSSKGGITAKLLKNPFSPSSQGKEKPEDSGDNTSSTEKPKAKQNGFSAVMKSTFSIDKQEKSSDSDDEDQDNGENHKQSKLAGAMTKLNLFRSANKSQHEKLAGSDDDDSPASSEKPSGNKQSAVVGAMNKLNPFRSATKKDADDLETLKEAERRTEEKPKAVTSNMIHRERKERSETPAVPPRLTKEEVKGTSTDEKVSLRGSENMQGNKDMTSKQKKEKPTETPLVPARPSVEELKGAAGPGQKSSHQNQSDDETLKDDGAAEGRAGDEANKRTKKKHKHHNPFMRAAAKAASDDEGLEEEESLSKEENEDGKAKAEETKVKKPKRHNPFMPRVKGKTTPKKPQDASEGNTAENDSGNRSLFDQLEEFRIEPTRPEDSRDAEDLMEWWNTVEPWEDTPQDEDLTEKEEAKAFAVTADKVQKGIRVFNKLFSERAESLWQHVIDLNGIAEALDKFNKNTKIAQITGGSTSAIGGVATITGLALAPFTMGTSLIVTAVGLGVATAGGLTSAGAGISNQVNNSMDRKKVEKIVEDYQEKILDLNKCLKFIKQGIENLRKFDLLRIKNHAYNRDFPVLSSSFYEDGAMAGKAILINANEIMRVVQIANVAGSTAARAVQIASMATGVLTGLFVGMDIYFVAKDSKELKKGAKSEFAAKIREVALQLHEGLVELNTIREELQSTTTPEDNAEEETTALEKDTKNKVEDEDSSEDEIDRIKKAIKKDMENKEYKEYV